MARSNRNIKSDKVREIRCLKIKEPAGWFFQDAAPALNSGAVYFAVGSWEQFLVLTLQKAEEGTPMKKKQQKDIADYGKKNYSVKERSERFEP